MKCAWKTGKKAAVEYVLAAMSGYDDMLALKDALIHC